MVAGLFELNDVAKYCHQRSEVAKDTVSSVEQVWAPCPVRLRAWREIRITTVEAASLKINVVQWFQKTPTLDVKQG